MRVEVARDIHLKTHSGFSLGVDGTSETGILTAAPPRGGSFEMSLASSFEIIQGRTGPLN